MLRELREQIESLFEGDDDNEATKKKMKRNEAEKKGLKYAGWGVYKDKNGEAYRWKGFSFQPEEGTNKEFSDVGFKTDEMIKSLKKEKTRGGVLKKGEQFRKDLQSHLDKTHLPSEHHIMFRSTLDNHIDALSGRGAGSDEHRGAVAKHHRIMRSE